MNNGDEKDNIGDKIVNEIWDIRDKKTLNQQKNFILNVWRMS